jgi:DNA-binding NtrC family response regulator
MMRRLLIIDDDELLRNSLGVMLGARGFLCTPAPSALDGIEQAEAGQFDVALVDINMPGLNGFEVIKALVRIEPRMSVVAMSGRQFDGDLDYAVIATGLGAHAFLPKPFRPQQLLEVLEARPAAAHADGV